MNEAPREYKKTLVFAAVLCIGILAFAAFPAGPETGKSKTITVSAAASLTEAFTDIAEEFEASHPGTDVELNFAGSGTLRMQIEGGAPIDVFASASQSHMNILSEAGLIEENSRKDFTSNTLVMIVPKSSVESGTYPTSLEALTAKSVEKISIGNPETAPVGRYAKQALEEAGIWREIEGKLIYAENVKQVLTYVETGEVETGFVYRTDAESGQKDLYEITYTVPINTSISYPIAVLSGSENKDTAQEFVDFVTGQKGQGILEGYGFGIAKI